MYDLKLLRQGDWLDQTDPDGHGEVRLVMGEMAFEDPGHGHFGGAVPCPLVDHLGGTVGELLRHGSSIDRRHGVRRTRSPSALAETAVRHSATLLR